MHSQQHCPCREACKLLTSRSCYAGLRAKQLIGMHVLQVCCALQVMHQQQPPLAHRDVKPHNVLVRQDQPDAEAARKDASSASHSSRQQAGELKGNGEAEPLQSSHAGQTRRYHAVLMVRQFHDYWLLQHRVAIQDKAPGKYKAYPFQGHPMCRCMAYSVQRHAALW